MERVGRPGWGGRCARLFPVRLARGGRFFWSWRDTPEGTPPPACLYIYPEPVHSLRGGCYQLAGAHTLLLEGAGALWAAIRHGEAVPCAHRRPDFTAWESPWLVLPACVFTLHIYSAHLLCTLTLLYFTPRTFALLYGAPSARPSLHLLPPL